MRIILIFLIFGVFIQLSAILINIPLDYDTIQEGIDIANDGDTVLVHPGTYYENINYTGKNLTVASLFLLYQDTTYISETIVERDSYGPIFNFESGEDSTAVLTGITLNNGFATLGGGIHINFSNPSLKNIVISNCTANQGGGIFCSSSNPTIKDARIINNNVDLMSNPGSGGGIFFCNNSSPILENVVVMSNSAFYGGGGISFGGGNPTLINVTISNNSSENLGGGISCSYSDLNLTNVILSGNSAGWGGGIYCGSNSNITFLNVTISDNSANYGGGLHIDWVNSQLNFVNSILWNDSPQEIYFNQDSDLCSTTISFSNIQGGEDGIITNNVGTVSWLDGNIDIDPMFIGSGNNPYSLADNSQCIDTGIIDTSNLNLPPWDIIGNHRIWDGDGDETEIVDMGVYEYGAPPFTNADDQIFPYYSVLNYKLHNFPNPFNPATDIKFTIYNESNVEVIVFNVKGQQVKSICNSSFKIGEHSVSWDGKNNDGKSVSSGLYYYGLCINNRIVGFSKCVLLK